MWKAPPADPALLDPAEAWKPWRGEPFTLRWAAHLFRRAGFGAPAYEPGWDSWAALRDAVKQGLDRTLDRLLSGGPGEAEFERLMEDIAPKLNVAARPFEAPGAALRELQGWWLYRMVYTPHPLRERLTLFWHN